MQAYREYAARVPRWIPAISRSTRCETDRDFASASSAVKLLFVERDTLFSERGTFLAMAAGYLLLWLKARSLSVCHRYQDATDRYGRHASPIFRIRFASGACAGDTAAESR